MLDQEHCLHVQRMELSLQWHAACKPCGDHSEGTAYHTPFQQAPPLAWRHGWTRWPWLAS